MLQATARFASSCARRTVLAAGASIRSAMPPHPLSPELRTLLEAVSTSLHAQETERALDAARRALFAAQTPSERAAAQYWLARCH